MSPRSLSTPDHCLLSFICSSLLFFFTLIVFFPPTGYPPGYANPTGDFHPLGRVSCRDSVNPSSLTMSSSLEAKIVVLGSQGVGKTSLVNRYVKNAFEPAKITSTVGASFVTKRVLDTTSDTIVRLQIWDTAGQERFRSISRLYYRGANACLLCYDITDENSFREMTGWLQELKENLGHSNDTPGDSPLVIHVVGTKSDIVALEPSRRKVPFERTIAYVAEQLYPSQASTPPPTAGFGNMVVTTPMSGSLQSPDSKRSSGFWGQDIGWDCCHEISAKDGEGVEEVFRVIARKLVEQRNKQINEMNANGGLNGGLADLNTSDTDGGGGGGYGMNGMTGRGSFRIGLGDKRRSWLGFPPGMVVSEEMALPSEIGRHRRPCC
ncbi:ras-like GTP-binding protein, putative [Talaromyces stipitatus ATCC 10500]|uniref:Ras-like GTP-binding protein, putative n=1 Tax=Talaromyces stipitatus (strain ATCC 10500 / CBS 375.48 / QM 6759 / NRRL 1006) TaxID=441959 RepID=B8MP55_TALSN|nr:ras-like GTP-binding protein, putative [Talaromyces stipitatus ATCC 10500]EED14294.1 ras-like GTP-binding protein, putative [Talaromyces stipitatus ATCC 10500]